MKTNPLKLSLLAALAAMPPVSVLHAAVNISNPGVPDPFAAVPAVADWSTLNVAGTAPANAAALDAAVNANANATATGVNGALATDDTPIPAANGVARWNSAGMFLQTRPTGNAYTLLMATLVNSTGGAIPTVKLTYDYAKATNTASEVIKGHRVYYSTTGLAGSWTLISNLSVDTTGTIAAPQTISAQFRPAAPLADGATVYVLWADQNSSGTDASYHIDNFAASPGTDCTVTGSTITPVRLPGVDPADPSDDFVTFSTTITGAGADLGPGWTIVTGPDSGTNGNYGDPKSYNVPIADFTAGPITLKFADRANADCTYETVVAAPPFTYIVSPTNSPVITFGPAAVGDGAYTPPATTLAEPGWSGGTTGAATVSNVQVQPLPSAQTLKYFHLTNGNVSLTTSAVDVNAVKGALLEGSIDFAFYSTSTSGLDNPADVLNSRLEVALDGDFANTAAGNILTVNIQDVPAGSATAFGAAVAVGNPYINLAAPPAVAPAVSFPSTDFTFHPRSAGMLIPSDAANPRARIIVQSIAGITGTEHLLVDNIKFAANTNPSLSAVAVTPATWANGGTVETADDFFSVPVNISGFNLGASSGWTSNSTPATGLYATANPVTFGPFPGRTPVPMQLTDIGNPLIQSGSITLSPPAATLTATLVAGSIVRHENGAGEGDDTVTCAVNIAGANAGPSFTANTVFIPTTVAGAGAYPAVGTPVTLTLSNIPNVATTVNLIIADASYPANPAPVTVAIAVPVPTTAGTILVGKKDFGAGLSDVVASGTPDPLWVPFPSSTAFVMTAGVATDSIVESEVINLVSVGDVAFSGKFIAADISVGSNFEPTDRFKAELLIDGGLVPENIINLIDALDAGNGANSTATATNGLNGPKNGFLNGYAGTAGLDLVTNTNYTVAEDEYNANKNRDEFNTAGEIADIMLNNTINLSATVPANANSVQLRITGTGAAGSEAFTVKDALFTGISSGGDSDGDGVSDAYEVIMGTSPSDPNDVLRLTQAAGNANQFGFPTKAGRFYRVYKSSNNLVWNDANLGTFIGDGNTASFTITPTLGREFSRLHVMTTDGPWPSTVPAP